MARNVELKARLRDPRRQRELALSLGDSSPEILSQEDCFFRVPGGRLKLRFLGPKRASSRR
jgi:adenylate cyclase class IV